MNPDNDELSVNTDGGIVLQIRGHIWASTRSESDLV